MAATPTRSWCARSSCCACPRGSTRPPPRRCAGIPTYSPLRHWGAGPGKKVGVVGLGGLGHMAVKLAHALGAEVTLLSHSDKKREDSTAFGADHYANTSD